MTTVRSMTGAGWARGSTSLGELTVDARSVNGRNLLVKTRLPPPLQAMEREVERRVRARLARGTVTVHVSYGASTQPLDTQLDADRFAAVVARLEELAVHHGLPGVTVRDVLAVPGVLRGSDEPVDLLDDELREEFVALIDTALDALLEERQVEGARTVQALREPLVTLRSELAAVEERAPALVADYRQRLLERVREFLAGSGATLDDGDVIREVAVFADRVDVSEELQRLGSHLHRIDETLVAGGEVGRPLEFLLQEVLREVNTIGSKSPDVTVAHAVVAMKSAVDKVKEQAANLE